MIPFPSFRVLSSSAICATLVACASSTDPPAGTVTRTAAPLGYEKTISNYFAFRLPGPQKNTRIIVSPPEPGSCPGDGYVNSARGWVVPVSRETFNGELTGRETIRITARQYYFWFMGNTISGISRRLDLCPGIESAFDDVNAPAGAVKPVAATPANGEGAQRDRPDSMLTNETPRAARAADRAVKPAPARESTVHRAKKKKARPSATARTGKAPTAAGAALGGARNAPMNDRPGRAASSPPGR